MAANEAFNLRIGYLHPNTVELARTELRETPEVRAAALAELRELLHAANDLNYRDDDAFLIIFLRNCHFYPQSALAKMRAVANFRLEYASVTHGLLVETIKEKFLNSSVVNVLKNCDPKGRRVLLCNLGEIWDPSVVDADDVFRLLYLVHVAAQLEEETQVRGVVVIMDFDGLSMKQIKVLSPGVCKRLLTFIQEAMPIRLKEVHFVKQPFIFKMVWSLIKPFVQEKLNKRMHFHGSDMKSLHKFISASHLPANYKGDLPAIDYGSKEWLPALESQADYVRQWSEFGPAKW